MNRKEVVRACSRMSGLYDSDWPECDPLEATFASTIPFNHKDGGSCSSEIFVSIYQNLVSQDSRQPNRCSDCAPPEY